MKGAIHAAAGRLLGRQQISYFAVQPLLAGTGEYDRLDSLSVIATEDRRQTESWESSTDSEVGEGRRLCVAKVTLGRQEP